MTTTLQLAGMHALDASAWQQQDMKVNRVTPSHVLAYGNTGYACFSQPPAHGVTYMWQ